MSRYKRHAALLAALAIIAGIMLACGAPSDGDSPADEAGDGEPLVVDLPKGPGEGELAAQALKAAEDALKSLESEPSPTSPVQGTSTSTPTSESSPTPPPEDTATPTLKSEATIKATPTPAMLTPTPMPTSTSRPTIEALGGRKAAEIVGIDAWINSQPLAIAELVGKVVLVDFWTYTCVNCIRTFPHLKTWHAKYADDGLVIVGVHTPEFEFEKNLDNVRRAVKDNGIGWAVALDNDFDTWNAYNNRAWPAKYLIDKDGDIRYEHLGEGAYADTERVIRDLLEEAGADLSAIDPSLPSDQELDEAFLNDPSAQPTRELYAGWYRGYRDAVFGRGGFVGPVEYYLESEVVVDYQDSGEHDPHRIYLQGPWFNGGESLKHERETEGYEDHMALRFSARSVNVVINPEGEDLEPFKVLVSLDGEPMSEDNKGDDVVIEEDGRSFLYVDEPRMYSVVQASAFGTYELKLNPNSEAFAVFAFTFGFYESGV